MVAIPHDALRVTFFQTGQTESFPDRLLHTKTVPHAILALPRFGRYEVTASGQTVTVGAGEAFLSPAQCPLKILHLASADHSNTMAARWLHFTLTLFESVDFTTLFRLPLKVSAPAGPALAQLVDELIALQSPPAGHGIRAAVRLNECLWQALRMIADLAEPRPMADELLRATVRFRPLLSAMHISPGRNFTNRGMAQLLEMSPSQFQHAFREALGVSPMRYLKRLRLNEAAQRLTSTDLTLSEIAEQVGYVNPFHLSRDFKRQFQLSPRDYRATHEL